jgi:hypothetical protein
MPFKVARHYPRFEDSEVNQTDPVSVVNLRSTIGEEKSGKAEDKPTNNYAR